MQLLTSSLASQTSSVTLRCDDALRKPPGLPSEYSDPAEQSALVRLLYGNRHPAKPVEVKQKNQDVASGNFRVEVLSGAFQKCNLC